MLKAIVYGLYFSGKDTELTFISVLVKSKQNLFTYSIEVDHVFIPKIRVIRYKRESSGVVISLPLLSSSSPASKSSSSASSRLTASRTTSSTGSPRHQQPTVVKLNSSNRAVAGSFEVNRAPAVPERANFLKRTFYTRLYAGTSSSFLCKSA